MKKRTNWVPYAVTAAVAGALVLFAWFNRDRLSPVVPGGDAPRFSAFTLSGEEVGLRDFRDKVVLVNIWATWCPPCREEMPSMQRLYEAVDDEDFEIVAISVDAPFGETDAFGRVGGDLETYAEVAGITFTILHDPTGKVQQDFQTTGIPESFVVDRQGVIFKKVAGATVWDAPQNIELIQRLLGG